MNFTALFPIHAVEVLNVPWLTARNKGIGEGRSSLFAATGR